MDRDLAALYGVETRTLNQAVRRNPDRFPADFLFQLTEAERDSLRSQIVISNVGRGGRRYLPNAFTEHGAFMAAGLLNSPQAVEVSVFVVRAFVKLRQLVLAHKDLAGKLDQLERKVGSHDEVIKQLVAAIRQLMAPSHPTKSRIGFHTIREPAREKTAKSNSTTRRLAMMNLAIRGLEADLGPVYADTFRRDLHKDLKADYVLAKINERTLAQGDLLPECL